MQEPRKPAKKENGLLNILINIIIPVFILNKLGTKIGPVNALILALSFPILYGIYDIFKYRKFNFISLLGLINISITGSFALLNLEGVWFFVKEAAFPSLIGLAVLGSTLTKRPFIESIFLNPQLIRMDLLHEKLKLFGKELEFHKHTRKCTALLSCSFFFSALGNFIIATKVFTPIDSTLSNEARTLILNEQIAEMTAKGAAILIIPSMIFSGFVLWYLLRDIRKMTGLKTEEILLN